MVPPKFWMALHPLDNPPWKCPGAFQSSQVNSPINHHLLLDSNLTVTSHLPRWKQKPRGEPTSPMWPGPSQTPHPLISYSVSTSLAHSYCLPALPRQVELLPHHRICLLHPPSFRYYCLPPLCPLRVFPHAHLLSEDLSVLCRVGIPQPPSCLDRLALLGCLQSSDYLLTDFLIHTCHREFCLSAGWYVQTLQGLGSARFAYRCSCKV